MPDLKLHYFDFHGGRGEVARLVMALGNIPFEDVRVPVAEWPAVRDTMPLRALPVLEVDGEAVTQSNAINRYLGRMAGLYPDDELEALRCDEVMDSVEDILVKVVDTFFMEDEDEKKAAREALASGPITLFLRRFRDLLLAHGGEYFADNRLTIADIKVYTWIKNLRSGNLDYIPVDLADTVAPELVAHFDRVATHPGIVAYYEAR